MQRFSGRGRGVNGLACAMAAWMFCGAPAWGIVSSNGPTGSYFDGVNINQLIGAEDFYLAGYAGTGAVIANVEAGHIWNGHDDLSTHLVTDPVDGSLSIAPGTVSQYINDPSLGAYQNLFDFHATMVGDVLGGFGAFDYGYILQDAQGHQYNTAWGYGIAPLSTIWSTAIASQWNPDPNSDFSGSFEITQQSFLYGYVTTMQTGVNGRRADVINSSWGFDDADGSADETKVIDGLAYANHQTVVIAAGNHDGANAAVTGPASGFNSISVAALSSDTDSPPYSHVADFSNSVVNDFTNPNMPPKYATLPQVRVAVDIAAPGDNLTLAAYLGLTGGHTSNSQLNLDAATLASTGNYFINMAGTSFASPIVAGAAGLVVDAGYANFGGGTSVDGRVVKAILLNTASKPVGWDNGQVMDEDGVIHTEQALDEMTGTGMLDLHHALLQYTGGTTDVPGLGVHNAHVLRIGWDFAESKPGSDNDYYIDADLLAGVPLAVTLDWFVDREYDDATQSAADVAFADLDLQVWRVLNGVPTQLVATSDSAYSNVEHLFFDLPVDGQYMLRVHYYADVYDPINPGNWQPEDYALAWMVPEPSTPLLLCLGIAVAFMRRERALRR